MTEIALWLCLVGIAAGVTVLLVMVGIAISQDRYGCRHHWHHHDRWGRQPCGEYTDWRVKCCACGTIQLASEFTETFTVSHKPLEHAAGLMK